LPTLDWPSNAMARLPRDRTARSATNPREGASQPFWAERAPFPIRSYCIVLWGFMMSEPTVDEIMEKAKQLCRLDGMLWSNLDFLNPVARQSRGTARLAGEGARRRYLKRAQTLLDTEARSRLPS
jgi:hypothetical protein